MLEEMFDVKYDTQQDILAIVSVAFALLDQETSSFYKKVIKGKFQEMWMSMCGILEERGLIKPCGCAEHERCEKCIGRRYVGVEENTE